MKHLFVSYELALKLREKGFDEECLGVFHQGGNLKVTVQANFPRKNSELVEYMIAAPLFQQAVDWFREKHGVDIDISCNYEREDWFYGYRKHGYSYNKEWKPLVSYYEALTKAINEALKLIRS